MLRRVRRLRGMANTPALRFAKSAPRINEGEIGKACPVDPKVDRRPLADPRAHRIRCGSKTSQEEPQTCNSTPNRYEAQRPCPVYRGNTGAIPSSAQACGNNLGAPWRAMRFLSRIGHCYPAFEACWTLSRVTNWFRSLSRTSRQPSGSATSPVGLRCRPSRISEELGILKFDGALAANPCCYRCGYRGLMPDGERRESVWRIGPHYLLGRPSVSVHLNGLERLGIFVDITSGFPPLPRVRAGTRP